MSKSGWVAPCVLLAFALAGRADAAPPGSPSASSGAPITLKPEAPKKTDPKPESKKFDPPGTAGAKKAEPKSPPPNVSGIKPAIVPAPGIQKSVAGAAPPGEAAAGAESVELKALREAELALFTGAAPSPVNRSPFTPCPNQ